MHPQYAACANQGVESLNHVLLSCQVAWSVWSAMLKWWDVQGALPNSVEAVLDW